MKYIQNVKCSREEVWNALRLSVLYEIKIATSKTVEVSDIKNDFQYQKNMKATRGGTLQTDVVIKEFEENQKYTVQFTTYEGINTLSYTLEELPNNECRIVYEEDYKAIKKLNGWNAKLVGGLLSYRNKNKIKKMFKSIENYVISQREAE